MSTLKVNNLQDINGANNSTPSEVANGRAKVWVHFSGLAVTATADMAGVRDSYNVSSVVDNGTGDYTINFSITFANNDYVACVMPRHNARTFGPGAETSLTTTSIRVASYSGEGSLIDRQILGLAIFGEV